MKKCKKCGRTIPNDKIHKRTNVRTKKTGRGVGDMIFTVSTALAKSATSRTAYYTSLGYMFRNTNNKYK